nr:hypothetical protein [Tanacetum cinerariifolium]
MRARGFFYSGGGGEKKKKNNNNTDSGDASLDHPSKVNDGKNARFNATARTSIITVSNIPSGTYNASTVLTISHTHKELNKGPIPIINFVNVIPTSPNKNGSELAVNEPVTLIATKIGTPMMLDLYTTLCVWNHGRSSYAQVLIEINACINFNNNLVMVVPNLEGNGYIKETICIEYEWMPPRCSTCLVYGHSFVDCPKGVPKRVVNSMDKGNGQTSGADGESVIEVKKRNL